MHNDPKITDAQTVEQHKIMQYISRHFDAGALELELIDRYTIKATDNTGATITFYWDPTAGDAGEVKWNG